MATTLGLVNSADKEAKQVNQLEQIDKIKIPTDILPEEKEKPAYNVIFKLVKKKKGRTRLDNCAKGVINPKTQIPERIWYLDGAHSIWDSELNYILSNKDRYDRARRGMDITFVDGILRVKNTDVLLLEFLRKHPYNVGKKRTGSGKWDFYEYNPADEQRERHEKQLMQIEMVLKVKDLPFDRVEKLAAFFGIPFVDEIGMKKSEEGLRTELMLKAQNDPATFQKYIDSKEVEVSYLVKKAILTNKIDLGGESGKASWANGRGFIAKIPASRKAYEFLSDYALTPDEGGRKFLEQLKEMVN